jgi:hypothetical protein
VPGSYSASYQATFLAGSETPSGTSCLFDTAGTLEEAGREQDSQNRCWWLNSGAYLYWANGQARTIEGRLPTNDPWQKRYEKSSSLDTQGGYEPQNIFRLVRRGVWQNLDQQVYFQIQRFSTSTSPNRNESNGLLLFNHYQDANNLYYAGLRVDGTAVIKKKQQGLYTTLAQTPVLKNLPLNHWLGIRTVIKQTNEAVQLDLFLDLDGNGQWRPVIGVEDKDRPIFKGAAGIRTDFMDVNFKDYRISY